MNAGDAVLETARLRLEPIDDRHEAGLLPINGDAEVMRYIGHGQPETPEQTRAGIARIKGRWATYGFSWWAFIERASGEIVGTGCIQHLEHDPAQPLEIGWRLRRDQWGKGLAIEAARAMARFAFDVLGAPRLYAVADPDNVRSTRVMERLGMRSLGIETHYDWPCATYRLERAEYAGDTTPAKD